MVTQPRSVARRALSSLPVPALTAAVLLLVSSCSSDGKSLPPPTTAGTTRPRTSLTIARLARSLGSPLMVITTRMTEPLTAVWVVAGPETFGAASVPSIPVTQVGRRARNMGVHFIFVYLLRESEFESVCAGINACAQEGKLQHRIGGVFTLAELAKAHDFAEKTTATGHVVVEC